jgi:hypothetical protein
MPQPAVRNSSNASSSGGGSLPEQLCQQRVSQRSGVSPHGAQQARPAASRARTGRLDFFSVPAGMA